MSFGGVLLSLMVGKVIPSPAPASLVAALRRVEVTRGDEGPSGFQLQFQISRSQGSQDYDLLTSGTLDPFNRIVLVVTLGGVPNVLMDGLITHRQVAPGRPGQPDMLTVTGEDVSVAMDLIQYTMPYPEMTDAAVVGLILLKYSMYGVVPTIIPTDFSISTAEVVTQQSATDRAFINELACRHGYVFQIIPGPSALMNLAYFGPPRRVGMPQPTLTVNEVPGSNVESVSFSYNALAPNLVLGVVQDTLETDMDVPIVTVGYTRIPPLASRSAFIVNAPFERIQEFSGPGMDPIQAYSAAMGTVNRSADDALTAEGVLDTFRYQAVLSAPGLVALRGAGLSHDGLYYVKSVTHQITPDSYKQQFSLTREGLGSLLATVSP